MHPGTVFLPHKPQAKKANSASYLLTSYLDNILIGLVFISDKSYLRYSWRDDTMDSIDIDQWLYSVNGHSHGIWSIEELEKQTVTHLSLELYSLEQLSELMSTRKSLYSTVTHLHIQVFGEFGDKFNV